MPGERTALLPTYFGTGSALGPRSPGACLSFSGDGRPCKPQSWAPGSTDGYRTSWMGNSALQTQTPRGLGHLFTRRPAQTKHQPADQEVPTTPTEDADQPGAGEVSLEAGTRAEVWDRHGAVRRARKGRGLRGGRRGRDPRSLPDRKQRGRLPLSPTQMLDFPGDKLTLTAGLPL